MTVFDNDTAYRLAGELLKAIQSGDAAALAHFGINRAIAEEISEELVSSGGNLDQLTLPPYPLAFQADRTGRVPFDSEEMQDEPQSRRLWCQLWSAGAATDLTLVADYAQNSLAFRLLETD